MSTVLPYELSCGLLIYVFCQKVKDNDGWNDKCILSKASQRKILIGILKIVRSPDNNWTGLLNEIKNSASEEFVLAFIEESRSLADEEELLNVLKVLEALVSDQPSSTLRLSSQSIPIKRTSVLGLFIRKMVIKFKKFSFEDIHLLIKDFLKYRDVCCVSKSCDESANETSASIDLSCADEETGVATLENNKENISISKSETIDNKKENFTSRSNVFKFIEEQMNFLENDTGGALKPKELQEKLELIQKLHANITDVYYLSFLNYLRVSEVNKASKMLCLYFDHKNFQSQLTNGDRNEQEKHQSMFKRFRYGALNLGIMHSQHRNYAQAMIVFKEAVCISQETNDDVCLKHAMFWIQVIKEETNQLDNRAIETQCCDLMKDIYTEDENVIDNLQDIECFGMLRCAKILALRGLRSPDFILSNTSRIVVSNSKVSDTALLTRSSILDFYGFTMLSLYNCQFPLQTLIKEKKLDRSISEENLTVALCHLAVHFGSSCQYEKAFAVLNFIEEHHPLFSTDLQSFKKCRLQIQFQQCVVECRLQAADHIAEFFSIYDTKESSYMKSVVDMSWGNYNGAFVRASTLHRELESGQNSSLSMLRVQVRLLLIELKLCSLDASQCINDILELFTLLNQLKMNQFLVDAQIYLVRYNMSFGLFEKALQLIENSSVLAFTHSFPHQQGMMYFLQAKCTLQITLLRNNGIDDKERIERLESVLRLYDHAFTYFTKANSKARLCDVFYEQALVYHELGLSQERNTAATQYRILHENFNVTSKCMMF